MYFIKPLEMNYVKEGIGIIWLIDIVALTMYGHGP